MSTVGVVFWRVWFRDDRSAVTASDSVAGMWLGDNEKRIPYSAYISRVFNFMNFANLELFTKFIQLKFESLRCHMHGQHAFVNFFQRIPSK